MAPWTKFYINTSTKEAVVEVSALLTNDPDIPSDTSFPYIQKYLVKKPWWKFW